MARITPHAQLCNRPFLHTNYSLWFNINSSAPRIQLTRLVPNPFHESSRYQGWAWHLPTAGATDTGTSNHS
jgi:hypothetical protein